MSLIPIINDWSELWAGFMWSRSIEALTTFTVIFVLWYALRKRISPQLGYALFLLVFVKILLPFSVSVPAHVQTGIAQTPIEQMMHWNEPPWRSPFGARIEKLSPIASETIVQNNKVPLSSKNTIFNSLSLFTYLMAGWGLIVMGLFFRFLWRQGTFALLVQRAQDLSSHQLIVNFEKLTKALHIRRPLAIKTHDAITAPVVYGFLRPVLLLPPDFCHIYTPDQIRWILLHELAHIRRFDTLAALVQKLVQILFFFHPVIWLTNWILDQQREYACDDIALLVSNASRIDCSRGFLSLVQRMHHLPVIPPTATTLGLLNYHTQIRRRMMRILDTNHKLHIKLTVGSIAFLALMALLILPSVQADNTQKSNHPSLQWQKIITESNSPPQLQGYAMCYDETREKTVLFGGFESDPRIMHNETWEWDGNDWEKVNIVPSERPSKRFLNNMVYDPLRKKIVMYGGANVVNMEGFEDTWEFDGSQWKKITIEGPGIRFGHAMAYDPNRKTVLLFGGDIDDTYQGSNDLWEYNGKKWIEIPLDNAPPPRGETCMTLDEKRNIIVLFGGEIGYNKSNERDYGDTWEWDGEQFSKVSDSGPESRHFVDMAYSSNRGKVILFGGESYNRNAEGNLRFNDTWEWDGNNWKKIDVSGPQTRSMIKLVYDKSREKIVLFGGYKFNDTWELDLLKSGILKHIWKINK